MSNTPVVRMIDPVTVPVPDLELRLEFYRDRLGHELLWRNELWASRPEPPGEQY
jgi:catechol 2,3-dioxygenase-like lactoylglutathione lyase family enzyme